MDQVTDISGAREAAPPEFLIGIGASAGGLEALEQLFDGLASDKNNAFVVVTHLSPDFRTLLDELLARRTEMPVYLVEDGVAIRANAVYVLPPKKDMHVVGDRLYLRDRVAAQLPPVPIDTFFLSLAREWGSQSVAVILSGTGSDGSRGICEIKDSGGQVFVQEPSTARFSGMPDAAILRSVTDKILPPGKIAEELGKLARGRCLRAEDSDVISRTQEIDSDSPALARIILAVFGVSDIDFSFYKTSTFKRRVEKRMRITNCESLFEYADLVQQNADEAKKLSDQLLISVTDFFRDPDAHSQLTEIALRDMVAARVNARLPLRVWCAGCSTGQEAYSIAIAIHEIAKQLNKPVAAQIFATDISEASLKLAGRGVYTEEQLKNLDQNLIKNYFHEKDDQFMINKNIRKWMVFAKHDLIKDPPFTKIDIIICRNVLIYINPDVQQQILALFHFSLNTKGVLFLGPSESLGKISREFESLNSRWRIFRKAHDRPLHLGPTASALTGRIVKSHALDGASHRYAAQRKEAVLIPAYTAMLDLFAPPSALVSADRELLHTFGAARRFLRPPSGVTNLDIINMVDSALRTPIATGIERAVRERQEIVFPEIPLRENQERNRVGVRIIPLSDLAGERPDHVLVILEPGVRIDHKRNPTQKINLTVEDITRRHMEALEVELRQTRKALQTTIGEGAPPGAALQSSNETLIAANEELKANNKELNSTKEELHAVNMEYQRQNKELISLNEDIESLLQATEIGVLFVDDQMLIRRATSAAGHLFNLITDDVGRRVGHLKHRFVDFEPEPFIEEALKARRPIDREFLSESGAWWLIRCAPHRFSDGGHGAVLSIVNIDRLKSAALDTAKNP
jgi:two-component system CheB/CheR fusion protein